MKDPYQAIRLYRTAKLGSKWTPVLGSPIGTDESLMSQNSGHAIPPFASPQKKNAKAPMTSGETKLLGYE